MTSLSARASALLQELARDHGLREIQFDRDGLIPIKIGDVQIAVAYSPANDSLFLIGMLNATAEFRLADPWQALVQSGALAARRTRIAVEPTTKTTVLVCEIPLENLAYWQFNAHLDAFLADHAAALQGAENGGTPAAGIAKPDIGEDLLMIRI